MRDPYDILGIARGASLDEIKAAYRRACKTKHPDMGGSHEAMTELNTAYAFILNELKRDYQRRQEEAPQYEQAGGDQARAEEERRWRNAYRDIDDELEELRRAAQAHEETLRTMRAEAWQSGDRAAWAKLTFDDLSRFFRGLLNSGLKGMALLFAALLGVGGILVETNFVSGLVILGSGIGFFLSLALKNDKGGFMSAGLLLFGLMTIWLPPVRAALLVYPLATVSVSICLALILKFGQQGGAVGLMTGGVLALFIVSVIVDDAQRRQQPATPIVPARQPSTHRAPKPPAQSSAVTAAPPQQPPRVEPSAIATATVRPPTPEIRELRAAHGSILKFVSGVPYQLKARSGSKTTLDAVSGMVAYYRNGARDSDCVTTLEFATPTATTPYLNVDRQIGACDRDATMRVNVSAVQ